MRKTPPPLGFVGTQEKNQMLTKVLNVDKLCFDKGKLLDSTKPHSDDDLVTKKRNCRSVGRLPVECPRVQESEIMEAEPIVKIK